jgi:hypothetical protein
MVAFLIIVADIEPLEKGGVKRFTIRKLGLISLVRVVVYRFVCVGSVR